MKPNEFLIFHSLSFKQSLTVYTSRSHLSHPLFISNIISVSSCMAHTHAQIGSDLLIRERFLYLVKPCLHEKFFDNRWDVTRNRSNFWRHLPERGKSRRYSMVTPLIYYSNVDDILQGRTRAKYVLHCLLG